MKNKPKKITARQALLTSFYVDVLDVAVNFIVAIITGSVVMIAETIQGFADVVADVFIGVGLIRSSKKITKKHPIGYGKELYVWTFMAIVVMFLFTSTLTFYFGFQRFMNPEPIKNILVACVILTAFVFTNGYAFSISSRRLLDGHNLTKLIEIFKRSDMIETKTIMIADLVGTTAALVGLMALLIYGITGDIRFDGIGAMGVGITIFILTLFLIIEIKSLLVGKSASPGIERKIREIVNKNKKVNELLKMTTLNIGLGKVLVNLEVNLINGLITDDVEKVIVNLEKKIKEKVPEVKQIHIETRAKKTSNT